ncbi:MAG: citrate transporter [Clostridia bacterium]|nr:citrate transporter [Clostridia bacterium]
MKTHTHVHNGKLLNNQLIADFLHKFVNFCKNNVVMIIALFVALITTFFVKPDATYLDYFDFKTLTCLFCTLAVVNALKNLRFFFSLAQKTVRLFKTAKTSVLALVYITFIGSMFLANDMALLTFLPLGYLVLTTTGKEKYMPFTFIMQNIAANLGGMLTPFGNPQNLYLYSKFAIPTLEFIGIMLIPFLISIAIITLCCIIFVKSEPLEISEGKITLPPLKTTVYLLLFALAIIIVFEIIPYWIGLIIIVISLTFLDRKALVKVDYPLLFTFVFFFIFAGNMSRIEPVKNLFCYLLDKNTLLFSALSCQVISNVPSSILLAQFTTNYKDLLLGVNIGGVGTLISSLASLITLREFLKNNPHKSRSYILQFSIFNFSFLGILLLVCSFI